MAAVVRAFFGYLFLVLVVRIVGRRPGRQLTPFEFVLVFYMGGLALSAIVADEHSYTSAACQVIAIALAHHALSGLRSRSVRLQKIIDGTPLVLLAGGLWRQRTLVKMRIQENDVLAAARERNLRSLREVGTAILERNGDISILRPEQRVAGV